MKALTNKRAVITGASRGIGKSIAINLAENGCDVILLSRTQTDLDEVKEKLFKKAYNTYKNDPKLAEMMVTQPMVQNQKGLDNSKLAALTVVGNVLLNLDEFLMKR